MPRPSASRRFWSQLPKRVYDITTLSLACPNAFASISYLLSDFQHFFKCDMTCNTIFDCMGLTSSTPSADSLAPFQTRALEVITPSH